LRRTQDRQNPMFSSPSLVEGDQGGGGRHALPLLIRAHREIFRISLDPHAPPHMRVLRKRRPSVLRKRRSSGPCTLQITRSDMCITGLDKRQKITIIMYAAPKAGDGRSIMLDMEGFSEVFPSFWRPLLGVSVFIPCLDNRQPLYIITYEHRVAQQAVLRR